MARLPVGRVAPIYRGAYNSATQYTPMDTLTHNNVIYTVIKDCKGVAPPNTTYYMPQLDANPPINAANTATTNANTATTGANKARDEANAARDAALAAKDDLAATALRTSASRFSAHKGPASLLTFRPAPGSPMQVTCDKAGEVWAGGKNQLEDSGQYGTYGGVTVTRNADGSVTFNGTATAAISFRLKGSYTNTQSVFRLLAGKTYTFSKGVPGGVTFEAVKYDGTNRTYIVTVPATEASRSVTITADTYATDILLGYAQGAVLNNFTVYPMIELGPIATPYEPYVGSTHAITPNTPIEITAVPGVNHLIASAGMLTVDYNRDSMDVLDKLTDPVTDTAPVASIDGAIDDRPLEIAARAVATGGGGTPEEPIPIVGKPVVTPWRGGKNLLKHTIVSGTLYGLTWVVNADGSITVSGTPTSTLPINLLGSWGNRSTVHFVLKGGTTYARPTGVPAIQFYNRLGSASEAAPFIGNTVKPAQDIPCTVIYYEFMAGTSYNVTLYPQLELGSTATPYEAYTGATFPVPAPAGMEFYGLPGAPDEIVIGADGRAYWVKRTALLTLDGTEAWQTETTSASGYLRMRLLGRALKPVSTHSTMPTLISSHYPTETALQNYNRTVSVAQSSLGDILYFYNPTYAQMDNATAVAAWKSDLAAQDTAGTPVQVLYEPATPQIIPLDDVIIPSLPGLNQVYSDGGGDTTVTGRRGAAAVWDKLDAMQAQITALQALITK